MLPRHTAAILELGVVPGVNHSGRKQMRNVSRFVRNISRFVRNNTITLILLNCAVRVRFLRNVRETMAVDTTFTTNNVNTENRLTSLLSIWYCERWKQVVMLLVFILG